MGHDIAFHASNAYRNAAVLLFVFIFQMLDFWSHLIDLGSGYIAFHASNASSNAVQFSSFQLSLLTDWEVGGGRGLVIIKQRSSSSRRPLWVVLAWSGMCTL